MELKEKLQKIMAERFNIHTDEELNEAFEKMDLSFMGLFVPQTKEQKNE